MTRVTAARGRRRRPQLWEESAPAWTPRNKILTPAAALQLGLRSPVVVTGYFDVVLAAHAREFEQVRNRIGRLPRSSWSSSRSQGEILSARARAEMVAALRMVDYVVIADDTDLESLIASLAPSERYASKWPTRAARGN